MPAYDEIDELPKDPPAYDVLYSHPVRAALPVIDPAEFGLSRANRTAGVLPGAVSGAMYPVVSARGAQLPYSALPCQRVSHVVRDNVCPPYSVHNEHPYTR